MISKGIWTKEDENSFHKQLDQDIEIAWAKAMEDPYPNKEATLNHVYFNKT